MSLFRPPSTAVLDRRPVLLAVAALILMLLPFLLLTTAPIKLGALPLSLPGPSEDMPPELPGAVERLEVRRTEDGYAVEAAVRTTDVLATSGQTETRSFSARDLATLQEALVSLKALDPARKRITLRPAPSTSAAEIVAWMDAVRRGPSGDLFPLVALESTP